MVMERDISRGIELNPTEKSPSQKLVEKLFAPSRANQDDLSMLGGQRVKIMGRIYPEYEEELIGQVKECTDSTITILPDITHRWYFVGKEEKRVRLREKKEQTFPVYFVTDNPYDGIEPFVDFEDRRIKLGVFTTLPRMSVRSERDSEDIVAFHSEDLVLDTVLNAFPDNIDYSSLDNIKALTDFVYALHLQRSNLPDNNGKRPASIGKELERYKMVCRQASAIAFAFLELNGNDCVFVSTPGHMYVGIDSGVRNQTERIIVDPAWNLVGTYPEILQKLKKEEKPLIYHSPKIATDLKIVPDWSYLDWSDFTR